MTKFQVDKNQMDDYIKKLDKRRATVFFIVTLAVISLQTFIAYQLDSGFPFWIIIIVTVAVFLSFYFALRHSNEKLKLLSNGNYYINNSSLKLEGVNGLTREFKLDEIAIIHKKFSGTLVVKGNNWTKFHYIRPKQIISYQLGGRDIIFIPTITSGYSDLVEIIQETAKNAMKL